MFTHHQSKCTISTIKSQIWMNARVCNKTLCCKTRTATLVEITVVSLCSQGDPGKTGEPGRDVSLYFLFIFLNT